MASSSTFLVGFLVTFLTSSRITLLFFKECGLDVAHVLEVNRWLQKEYEKRRAQCEKNSHGKTSKSYMKSFLKYIPKLLSYDVPGV